MTDESELVVAFYKHLPSLEGNHAYMYLDSRGFLTIGMGIFVSKLDGKLVELAVLKLRKLEYAKIKTNQADKLKAELVNPLYKESSIKEALKKLEKLPFQIGFGKRVRSKSNNKYYTVVLDSKRIPIKQSERASIIKRAFDELLRKSILLKAQQKKLGSDFTANLAQSFFTCEGKKGANNLVISDAEIEKQAKEMIKEKIKQLRHYLPKSAKDPGYDGYPFPVQLALLDLSYNMGAKKLADTLAIKKGYEELTKLVKLQDWEKIIKRNEYHRKDVSKERNEFVKKLFEEAVKEKKAQTLIKVGN